MRATRSDIDGTITKSDVLGHLLPAMGLDWSHPGISRLFTDIAANSYQVRITVQKTSFGHGRVFGMLPGAHQIMGDLSTQYDRKT